MPALRAFVGWTGAFTTPVLSPAFLSSAANRSDFRSSCTVKHPWRITSFRAEHAAVGTAVRHHALFQHDLTLQQAHAQLRIDTPHLVPASAGESLLLLGQIAAMFIAEKQAKSVFFNEVGMILVPRPPDLAYCVVCALENHHRVMVYNKVCKLLHHALSSFLFCRFNSASRFSAFARSMSRSARRNCR